MKVLAAHRAGLKKIILPQRNEQELEDIPEDVREGMVFVAAENIDQVLDETLQPPAVAAYQPSGNSDNQPEPVLN